jgi:hypothetical protein
MSLMLHLAPRVVVTVAWALAFTVAAGASTPRLRTPGRERIARAGLARAGSQRPDDPRAWVAPGTEHDPEYTVADGVVDAVSADPHPTTDHAPLLALAPARVTAHAPAASLLANPAARPTRLTRWLVRPALGRAPPPA